MADETIPGVTEIKADVPAQQIAINKIPIARPREYQQDAKADPSIPATTTFQEDLTTAGQRKVNLIWEYTQALIAIMVVITSMISGVIGQLHSEMQVPNLIGVAFGMITGFYFSRTNHAAIGGIGKKPESTYMGR